MPVSRPRRKSGAVTSCPKFTGGAELHKRSAEASGFDGTVRLGRTGHKERTPWLVGFVWSRKDIDRIEQCTAVRAIALAGALEPSAELVWIRGSRSPTQHWARHIR